MIYTVEFSQFASDDLAEILDWYKDKREGLDKEFVFALETTLKQIKINPTAFQIRYKQSRNALLSKFPYKVVFKVFGNNVKIVAVIHHARNPKLIRKRLK